MRRLIVLLLAFMAFVPSLAMPATAAHHPAPSCAACPMRGDHGGGCVDHGCLGCSTEADPAATIADRPRLRTSMITADEVAPLAHHRPGFDPPPPRAIG